MERNVAGQIWVVFAFDVTDNTPVTGDAANITGNLRIDGGAANAIDDTNPAELEDGYYFFEITQAESNGDNILISPASSTADVQVIGVPGVYNTVAPNSNLLGIESDGDLTEVNTLTGQTVQTGDSFARIGVNGAGLTNIDLPNQTMDITGDLSGSVGSVVAAVTTDSASRTASQADVSDIPTNAEFNARTIPAADYFDPAADTVARVTLTDTTTTNTDMRGTDSALTDKTGYSLSAAGIDAILDEQIGDGTITMREALRVFLAVLAGETSGGGTTTLTFRNNADTQNVQVATVDANGNRTATTVTP